ncbi:MAG TPA: undecaprenyl-phosphate glucose phosphotransferase [Burkholderiaceae bacterium]|nr:undecaprenyl-phosphate glucose phosphotransferase [Burkholderiaceae bacterium]
MRIDESILPHVDGPAPFFAKRHRTLLSLAKRLIDPLVILSCLALVFWAFDQPLDGPFLILLLLTFLLVYPGRLCFRNWDIQMAADIFIGALRTAVLLLAVGYLSNALQIFEPQALAAWLAAAPLALMGVHIASPRIVPRVLAPVHKRKAAIVGMNSIGARLARIINTHSDDSRVIAFFDDRHTDRLPEAGSIVYAGSLAEVTSKVHEIGISTLYITLPIAPQQRLLTLLNDLRDTTCSIYFVPNLFLFDMIQAKVDAVGDIPVLAVCESPFDGVQGVLKRWSDIVIASVALVVSAPFALMFAIIIKLSSPGPVFFRQRRLGLNGQEIVVWKFRSMRVTEDGSEIRQATASDERVTAIGRFLRRSSLDELPQFINVLQGTMSVVGPRPHALAHDAMYRQVIRGYTRRHKVKPGITGWAQINGARGETDTLEKMARRVELDTYYLRNWSLKLDLIIIVRTIRHMLNDPHAY